MPVALPPAVTCPWERARYELVGDPDLTITTAPMAPAGSRPDLALRFRWGVTGRVLWFFGDRGSASIEHLISINDPTVPGWQAPDPDSRRGRPGADLIAMGYNADLTAAEAVARASTPAPAYLVIPEIADAMRDAADRPPNTLFRLSGCSPP